MKQSGANQIIFHPLLDLQQDGEGIITSWEEYSARNAQEWLQEGLEYQQYQRQQQQPQQLDDSTAAAVTPPTITSYVHTIDDNGNPIPIVDPAVYSATTRSSPNPSSSSLYMAPAWQTAPIPVGNNNMTTLMVNYDALSSSTFSKVFDGMVETNHPVFTEVLPMQTEGDGLPQSSLIYPIYDALLDDSKVLVGFINVRIPWNVYFINLLPTNACGIILVLSNSCQNQRYTFEINGHDVKYIGIGDLHDSKYDELEIASNFYSPIVGVHDESSSSVHCAYSIHFYPSNKFKETYETKRSIYFTTIVVIIFVLTLIVFVLYDNLARRKQKKAMASAARANDLIGTLFPATVRERLMEEAAATNTTDDDRSLLFHGSTPDSRPSVSTAAASPGRMPKRLSGILGRSPLRGLGGSTEFNIRQSDSLTNSIVSDLDDAYEEAENERLLQSAQKTPIADFFPKATVLFGTYLSTPVD